MKDEIKSLFFNIDAFRILPAEIQEKLIYFFDNDGSFSVDVADVRCALELGMSYKIFYTVEDFNLFLLKNEYNSIISYKTPLDTVDDFSDWLDGFMPSVNEGVVSAVMFSFHLCNKDEFYIAIL